MTPMATKKAAALKTAFIDEAQLEHAAEADQLENYDNDGATTSVGLR
jgi:hypothetical protein